MTDPSSTSWRRRRRGGKHKAPARRPSPSSPASPDAARANRDAAFDSTPKPWVGAVDATGHSAKPDSEANDSGAASPDEATTAVRSPQSAAKGRRRTHSAEPREGSLPQVAFWTVLTSVFPGSGLVTTSLRRLGWTLLGIMTLGIIGIGAWFLLGDPLRSGLMLLTNRNVLIGLMAAIAFVGVIWAIQIVLANLAHTSRQHLQGAKRYAALAVAALMVVAVAVPFGRGVHSVWAAQNLLGSPTVFGDGSEPGRVGTGKDPWAGVGRINVLLLGQDAGEDRTGTRPDTIMVASIDTESGHTALFSIPRNLEHVRFPKGTAAAKQFPDGFRYFGQNEDLINAVWAWAEDRPDLFPKDPEPGLTATTWAVEETLGLEMDYFAMVNLQGFEDLVDAIGGVDLVVERRIPIGGGSGPIDGYIEPGDQKLDGYHALWYARSREGSDDFNRMCRQQRIVRAVAEEADPTTLAMSVPGLVTATEKNIVTDIPVRDLDAFVDLALRIKAAGFTSYPITQDVTPSGDPDWDYLKEWTQASIEDSMKQAEPESVKGETDGGSGEPAPTGESPSAEEGEGATDPASKEPTEEETTSEAPTEEESTEEGEPSETPASEEPEIEQDPLDSCLPGSGDDG